MNKLTAYGLIIDINNGPYIEHALIGWFINVIKPVNY